MLYHKSSPPILKDFDIYLDKENCRLTDVYCSQNKGLQLREKIRHYSSGSPKVHTFKFQC